MKRIIQTLSILSKSFFVILLTLGIMLCMGSRAFANPVGYDGSFNYEIKIDLPVGTNGLTPDIALQYNSSNGNGIAGVGWHLKGFPVITRINNGNSINYNGTDTYAGPMGKLVHIGGGVYHTERETWGRYIPSGSCGDGPCEWTLTESNGTKLYFGASVDGGTGNSRVEFSSSVKTWALRKVEDTYGNYYLIDYLGTNGGDILHPLRVTYVKGNGLATYRTVDFWYMERFNDNYQKFSNGNLEQMHYKLSRIEVKSAGQLVRGYNLSYDYSPRSHHLRLMSVQEFGSNYVPLPAKTFKWSHWDSAYQHTRKLTRQGGFANNDKWFSGDFDGDGKTDLARVFNVLGAGTVDVYLSKPSFVQERWASQQGGYWDEQYWFAGDFNGDGKTDLAKVFNDGNRNSIDVHLSTGTGFTMQRWITQENVYDSNHQWFVGDFDGDGKTDILKVFRTQIGSASKLEFQMLYSEGGYFSKPAGPVLLSDLSYQKWFIGDFNGDGRADFAQLYSDAGLNTINVFIADGGRTFKPLRRWAFRQGTFRNEDRWFAGDFNGDGNTDLAQMYNVNGAASIDVFVSTGWDTFLRSSWARQQGGYWDTQKWFAGDFNGDGKTDLGKVFNDNGMCSIDIHESWGNSFNMMRWLTQQGGYWDTQKWFLGEFSGNGRPVFAVAFNDDSLTSIDAFETVGPSNDVITMFRNGLGGSIEVAYSQSLLFPGVVVSHNVTTCGGDSGSACGKADNSSRPLVERTIIRDGQNGIYTTKYSYFNGRYYPGSIATQYNLGFQYITSQNLATNEVKTISFYQTGHLANKVRTIEDYVGSTSLMNRTSYTYEVTTPYPKVTAVRLKTETQKSFELGTQVYTKKITNTYDFYGNITKNEQTADNLPTLITNTDYQINIDKWILNQPLYVEKLNNKLLTQEFTLVSKERFDVDFSWHLSQKCDWLLNTSTWRCTSMIRDEFGNVTSVTDALQQTTTMTYDNTYHAYPTAIRNAKGHVTRALYNFRGQEIAKTDANNRSTLTEYDPFGRVSKITRPDGGTTEYRYNEYGGIGQNNEVITKIDAVRTTWERKYFDGTGFVFLIESKGDSGVISKSIEKDSAGRVSRESTPHTGSTNFGYTTYTYDRANRITRVTLPNGTSANTAYYPGYIKVTDGNGNTETKYFNARSKVSKIVNANGYSLNFSYDGLERLWWVETSAGFWTKIGYDELGRRILLQDSNAGSTVYKYNLVDKLIAVTDPQQKTITYTYDVLNRVTSMNLPGADEIDANYSYDNSAMANGIGRLTRKTDAGGTTTFAYTSMGQVATMNKVMDRGSYIFLYAYNYAGNPTRIDYPSGDHSDHTYTESGNLNTVSLNDTLHASWLGYNSYHKPRKLDYANVTYNNYKYDTMGILTGVYTHYRGHAVVLQDLKYTYDNVGNVRTITDNRANKQVLGVNTDETANYSYDALNRLTRAQGVYGVLYYTYNAYGNMTNKEGKTITYDKYRAVSGTDFTATYNANGAMTSITMNGNSTTNYDYYTTRNLIKKVMTNGFTQENIYDDSGQRVKKIQYLPTGNLITRYISSNFEERSRGSSGPTQYTINLFGNGQMVASITKEYPGVIIGSRQNFRIHSFNAGLFDPTSLNGLYKKVDHLVAAYTSVRGLAVHIYKALLGLCALGAIMFLLYQLIRSRKTKGWLTLFAKQSMGLALTLMLISSLSFQGCFFDSSDFSSGDLYYVDNDRNTNGNATRGLPLGTFFYHKNHINSNTIVTDALGQQVTRYTYKPYGALDQAHSAGLDSTIYKFTGQEQDAGDLYYFGARYYNTFLGRFISPDTIVPDPGDSEAYNRYSYARNNPIRYIDPTGHSWLGDLWDGVKQTVGNAWESVRNTIGNAWESVRNTVGHAWENVKRESGRVCEQVKSFAGHTWESVKNYVSSAGREIGKGMRALWNNQITRTALLIVAVIALNAGAAALAGIGSTAAATAPTIGQHILAAFYSGCLNAGLAYSAGERDFGKLAALFGAGAVGSLAATTGCFGLANAGTAGRWASQVLISGVKNKLNDIAATGRLTDAWGFSIWGLNLSFRGGSLTGVRPSAAFFASQALVGLNALTPNASLGWDWETLSMTTDQGLLATLTGTDVAGFAPHSIAEFRDGTIYAHEKMHVWQSRFYGDNWLAHYILCTGNKKGYSGNFYETQADYGKW